MKLIDIAKTVGAAVFSSAVPGGAGILAAVNSMLPEEHKLPATATGNDLRGTVSALTPEQQAAVFERQFDVEETQIKEAHNTVRTMLAADAASTHTTRPYIAKGAFQLVAAVSLVAISLWAYAVISGNVVMVKQVMDGWEFVAAIITPFVVLLWAYFGILKQEHRARLNGGAPSGISGLVSAILSPR